MVFGYNFVIQFELTIILAVIKKQYDEKTINKHVWTNDCAIDFFSNIIWSGLQTEVDLPIF